MRGSYPYSCITCWSRGHMNHMANKKPFITSSTTSFVATNFDRIVADDKEPPTTKWNVRSITWSHEVRWQVKNFTFSFPRYLWPLNVTGWWFISRSHSPKYPHDRIATWRMKNVTSSILQTLWSSNDTG